MPTPPIPKRSKLAMCWLILCSLLSAFTLLPWFGLLVLTPMMFDKGEMIFSPIILGLFTFPIASVGLSALSWKLFAGGRNAASALIAGLVFVPVVWIGACS